MRLAGVLCVILALRLLYVYLDSRARSRRLSSTDTQTRKARYPFGLDIIVETLKAQKERSMLELWQLNCAKYGHTYRVNRISE